MRTLIATLALLAAGCASSSAGPAAPQGLAAGDLRRSGTVQFPVTCKPEVREDFQTAVALLHSFFYEEARRRFLDIAARDPECAMAWWGVAMTWYHPLWAPPTPAEMAEGQKAVAQAKRLGGKTDLERGFIRAVDAFYNAEDKPAAGEVVAQSCHGPRVHGARAVCFRDELAKLREKNPQEMEVEIFYALALLGTAPPTDKLYQNQVQAAKLLEARAGTNPDHPGIAHYIIHAYDYPTLAARGLDAARRYADIAPWVPHALHMPSHVYTRVGLWKESIASNLASAEAARDYARRMHGGAASMDELHALDYLVFAYLQTARDAKARAIVDALPALKTSADPNFASAYAVGAIPARWALERRRWSEAAALPMLHPELLKLFPFAEAHVEFARAVGAARGGDAAAARAAAGRLETIRERLKEPKFQFWVNQVEIQRLAAEGWIARAEKRDAEAEASLRKAGDLEDASGTHPVTPGQILPAREQLGDLLLDLGRPADALAEYEKSLLAFPRRFRSHAGAAAAAEKAGRAEVARKHHAALLEMSEGGDGLRPEIAAAKAALGR